MQGDLRHYFLFLRYRIVIIKITWRIVLDLRVSNTKSKSNEIKVLNAFFEDHVIINIIYSRIFRRV